MPSPELPQQAADNMERYPVDGGSPQEAIYDDWAGTPLYRNPTSEVAPEQTGPGSNSRDIYGNPISLNDLVERRLKNGPLG